MRHRRVAMPWRSLCSCLVYLLSQEASVARAVISDPKRHTAVNRCTILIHRPAPASKFSTLTACSPGPSAHLRPGGSVGVARAAPCRTSHRVAPLLRATPRTAIALGGLKSVAHLASAPPDQEKPYPLRTPSVVSLGGGETRCFWQLRSDFSHPISHRTPQYRVGNGEMKWLAASQKRPNFQTKPNCKIQDKMGCNGLGNRCSIRLSYGTAIDAPI